MTPKIDLLIPVYNGMDHLEVLLAEIARIRQVFAKIIFYDDASTDGSADYLEKAGFSVIRGCENRGPGFARNELFLASSADFIHYHDADDPVAGDFFSAMIPHLDPDHVCAGQFIAEDAGVQVELPPPTLLAGGTLSPGEALTGFIHLNSVIFPREAVARAGGFQPDLRLHEDRFLILSLAMLQIPWRLCLAARAIRRSHAHSTTSLAGERSFQINFVIFFERAFEKFPVSELDFLLTDLLHNSQRLLDGGLGGEARRGFALCEQAGAKKFRQVSSLERVLFRIFGFYRVSLIKGWLRPLKSARGNVFSV